MCVIRRSPAEQHRLGPSIQQKDDGIRKDTNLRLICPFLFPLPGRQRQPVRREPGNDCTREAGEKVSPNSTLRFAMGDQLHPPAVANTLLPVALCILTLLPHSLLGQPAGEDSAGSSALLQRVKRGWVWNQFFVLEEYTGLEPLYIGKVSVDFTLCCMNMHTYMQTH